MIPLDLATTHRPQDESMLRAAAVELSARGFTLRDIASMLKITEFATRQLLGEPILVQR